jgi:hypothetical protein
MAPFGTVIALDSVQLERSDRFATDLNISVTFEKNEYFEKDGGPEADAIWEKLLPCKFHATVPLYWLADIERTFVVGRGFIQVDKDGNAIPHDGQPKDLSQTKVVSVFHQLHCLVSISPTRSSGSLALTRCL